MFEFSKANLKSLLIHFWIIFLGSLAMMLPEVKTYLATIIDPELAGIIIMLIWIIIKKLLNSK